MENRIPIVTILCGADAVLRAIKSQKGSEVHIQAFQYCHN